MFNFIEKYFYITHLNIIIIGTNENKIDDFLIKEYRLDRVPSHRENILINKDTTIEQLDKQVNSIIKSKIIDRIIVIVDKKYQLLIMDKISNSETFNNVNSIMINTYS